MGASVVMSIVVTGGSGFLGTRLKEFQPEWTYLSSKECDLTDQKQTNEYFNDVKPDSIVHLAARVGGIKDNIENQAEFYYQNIMMNTNVLHAAKEAGIKRILSSLSTCAFPDHLKEYPFDESKLFSGPPASTNFSYGMTKRALQVQSMSYRKQYGLNFSTFSPSNIYGPLDHFGSTASHFIASLVHKVATAPEGTTIELWGTGKPLRQQLYVDDLCNIIPILLDKHNTAFPIIVAPFENLTIAEMAQILVKQTNKKLTLVFNGMTDGQFRKDGSNKELMDLLSGLEFTPYEVGIKKTYDWYVENQRNG